MKPVMLMILDGWGIAPADAYNAASLAKTPCLDRFYEKYPHTSLLASGNAVGLPEGQMGNSEVGHLNIGSGRIVYQELTRISKAIQEGTFFDNPVLLDCMQSAKDNHQALHLLGLLSDGGVHSHNTHLYALLQMAKMLDLSDVYVHIFLDGRDVGPKTALTYVRQLEEKMNELGIGRIATVSGRYYAMDRDKRWERTRKAYNAMTAHKGASYKTAVAGIEASYAMGVTDEFVEPFIVDADKNARVKAGDSMIFFNFRPDRARQLTRAFVDREFAYFDRRDVSQPVKFVCMTQYDVLIDAPVAFAPEALINTLGEVLAKCGLKQLRIAETEKYAHVTFFFNGGVEEANPLEERILIPSPKVATYDLQPEMSAYDVTAHLLEQLAADKFDAIILNFANPDMVGHTGILPAAIKAMEAVDECAGKIVQKVLALGGVVCITADHGNIEKMYDCDAKAPYTAHTTNPVPFIVVSAKQYKLHSGILADIAPTLLQLLNVEKPAEMTGKSLIDD